ncbi:MAG: hypothetical protein NVSMB3_05240 [Acidobacteriaceae bacterium]
MQQNDKSEDAVGGGAEDGSHGAQLGGALEVANLAVRESSHASDEEVHDTLQDKSEHQNGDQTQQIGSEEGDDVRVPITFEELEDAFILRGRSEEEHDYGILVSRGDLRTGATRVRQGF